MRTGLLLLSVALLASACLPIPNRRLYAPRVSGVVLRDGIAVAGARVRLKPSGMDALSMVTDAEGRFELGPIRRLRLTKRLLGDPVYLYALSIEAPGEAERLGWEGRDLGGEPPARRLRCELRTAVSDKGACCARQREGS